jgi:tRNA threonylcarbamoyladenosine biosynthesis protein TsaB
VKILALDTATENCSAALLVDGQLTARERLIERGHAEYILSMIDEVLAAAGASLAGVNAIAFGRGPGSFTGVRLAASVTQGLAHGGGVPVVPVSDLAAVAQRVLGDDALAQRVLVCNDARMREVYWGCFARSPADLAAPVGDERVSDPAQVGLPAGWSAGPDLRGAGTGFTAYPQLRGALSGVLDGIREVRPRAAEIALLAVPEVVAGRIYSPEEALPVYLRDDVVQPGAQPSSN